jgi:hypothetical protein
MFFFMISGHPFLPCRHPRLAGFFIALLLEFLETLSCRGWRCFFLFLIKSKFDCGNHRDHQDRAEEVGDPSWFDQTQGGGDKQNTLPSGDGLQKPTLDTSGKAYGPYTGGGQGVNDFLPVLWQMILPA